MGEIRSAKSVSVAQCAWRLLTRYVDARLRRLPEMTSQTVALSAADRPRDWGRCVDSNSFTHAKLQSRFLRRRRRRRRWRRVSGTQWTRRSAATTRSLIESSDVIN